jgi:anti-sigma regulatory factor (Ser/Thr protein kinase)
MTDGVSDDELRHAALFYRERGDYRAVVVDFIRAALGRREPVLVAVPDAAAGVLRGALGSEGPKVMFADMTEMGRNPAGIIPAVRAFMDRHSGTRISYVGEPAWPGRSGPELLEATKHEALINLAFFGMPANILCPYARMGLPASVLSDAEHTHPLLLRGDGESERSPAYLGPNRLPRRCERALPDPPPDAQVLTYDTDLRRVRALVASQAAKAGLPEARKSDLVLAVSEVAANTLRHTPAGGVLHVWCAHDEIICQTHDRGWITDLLAGRRRPPLDRPGGQGLWVVNQICDLVEMRSGSTGTAVRMHMSLRPQPSAQRVNGEARWTGRESVFRFQPLR